MCSEAGCERLVKAKGLCERHYKRAWKRKRYGEGPGRGRHGNHVRGENHHRYNHGQLKTSHGYMLVRVPEGHHLRQANGYAYEHQIVAEEMLGRRLEPDEVVHHKNEDTADNGPENLAIMKRDDHSRMHTLARRSGLRPETNTLLDGEEWHQFPEEVCP